MPRSIFKLDHPDTGLCCLPVFGVKPSFVFLSLEMRLFQELYVCIFLSHQSAAEAAHTDLSEAVHHFQSLHFITNVFTNGNQMMAVIAAAPRLCSRQLECPIKMSSQSIWSTLLWD